MGLCLASACNQQQPTLRRSTRLLFDTYVTITAFAPRRQADRAIALAFARLDSTNRRFNHLDSTSPLFRFNQQDEPLHDSEIVAVVRGALGVSELSGGVFDITVEPLVRLWGFYSGHPAVPDRAAIDSCRRLVGYGALALRGDTMVKLRPDVTIDLGGVAKGYALATAAQVLRGAGVDSAIIDIGGDVFAIGRKGDRHWRVGIRSPRADTLIATLAVTNQAVVTSGDYERFCFGPDSTRYCHIIDPRTGWPAQGSASSTVVMADPTLAQCWSKVLFILGPKALPLLQQQGIPAMLVTATESILTTPDFDQLIAKD